MIAKRDSIRRLKQAIFGCFFGIIAMFGLVAPLISSGTAFAEPVTEATENVEGAEAGEAEAGDTEAAESATQTVVEESLKTNASGSSCKDTLGELGWFVCPETNKVSGAVDWLHNKIEEILVINPVEAQDGKPIYEIWKYFRGVTNIVFIGVLLVVIYSQITGVGISNYGIKKILPKLIITAVLVNLSFIICALAVDVSNIIGQSLKGVFDNIQMATMSNVEVSEEAVATFSEIYASLAGGTALAIGGTIIAFETGAIWMLIPVVLGALVAVASALITVAMRQAVVALLIMISPLAFVAYILPNTEQWFKKWKQLFTRMLVFYPMFSALFGASSLAGWAIIASAKDGFWLILGMAVQTVPLIFSWKLMKMSGTFLGTINGKLQSLAARPLAANRAWADSRRELTKQKHLAARNAYTPSLRLMQFLNDRKVMRDEETKEYAETAKKRGQYYAVMRNYNKNGVPTAEGMEAYEMQARKARYQVEIDRHKNNMNKGLGQLEAVKAKASAAQKLELGKLDAENVQAFDRLKMEAARAEKIDYDNAIGFRNRMEAAMNAHFDETNWNKTNEDGKLLYKRHFSSQTSPEYKTALARYNEALGVMEGDAANVQYSAAYAAQAYDTQKKIMEAKMQKYFELLPPTRDVEYRLGEMTKRKDAAAMIDAIIPGLRILNQRGDTDLLKAQLDNILDKEIGGGIQLGTHASQALASFLMFEVKDNDPALRRFGKYINLETANVYNKNNRKVTDVNYEEYVKGYHDGEPDLVSRENPTGRMYAKKDLKKLMEGTSLDNIERTALSNLDDSLKRAYGFRDGMSGKDWKVSEYLRKREEIQTAFEPAFLSSSLKWLSGSEQINSGVKFWTGYGLEQRKKRVMVDGKEFEYVVTDDDGNPVYDLAPVWESKEFSGHEKEVKEYYRKKTYDYFKDQTTGQVLGMRTDYRDPTVEHLIEMYLNDSSDDETSEDRKEWYENAKADIQSRYGDEDIKVAKKKRDDDMTKLKREVAGRQLRKILDKTGKLEQIYSTRRSGAANNAKDWLRQMLNLDNKKEIYRYLDQKEQELKKKSGKKGQSNDGQKDGSAGGAPSGVGSPYNDASFRVRVMTTLNKTFEQSGDDPDPDNGFYEESLNVVKNEFGTIGGIAKQYEDFKKDNPQASRNELWDKLEEILGNFFAEQMDQGSEE